MHSKSQKDSSETVVKVVAYILVGGFSLICLFPFVLMITSSLMTEEEIIKSGFKLIPETWTLEAYRFLLESPKKLLDAYGVTLITTIVGTGIGLICMSMAGYVLNRKDFKYRNGISFFIYFTTLFSGGLVPSYILMVKYLGLKDSLWSMILPGMIASWSIFLFRNFMRSIPDSLYESAMIDGAGDFKIYSQIFLPLSGPSMATIGLFTALAYWNQWHSGMLYIQTPEKYPLQYFLQQLMNQASIDNLIKQGVQVDMAALPTQAVKMATAVLVVGPIVFLYPFLQRYFITGLTVGSVKG